MASFTSGIYCIRNIENNKIYIGASSNLKVRRSKHFSELKKNKHSNSRLQNAFNKYGLDSFIFEVIEYCDKKDLAKLENFYVFTRNSRNPKIGYNIAETNDNTIFTGRNSGWKHSEESKLKIKFRSSQIDNKLRIREIQKLAVEANSGVKRTYQQRLNIKSGVGSNNIIQIYNLSGELIAEFDFVKEASEFTGVKPSAIRNNLCGLSKKTRKFMFKIKEVSLG